MNKFKLSFSASAPSVAETCEPPEAAYVQLHYTVHIDGKPLSNPEDWSPVLHVSLLLGCNSSDWEYLLTCTCGHAGCVTLPGADGERIDYPTYLRRDESVVHWIFHRQFFEYLEQQGLVSGTPREVTFTFDADEFSAELAAGEQFAKDQEVLHAPVPVRLDKMNDWERQSVQRHLAQIEMWAVDNGPEAWVKPALGSAYPVYGLSPYDDDKTIDNLPEDYSPAHYLGYYRPSMDRGRLLGVGSAEKHLLYRYRMGEVTGDPWWELMSRVEGSCEVPDPFPYGMRFGKVTPERLAALAADLAGEPTPGVES